jgi:hypothetical protein
MVYKKRAAPASLVDMEGDLRDEGNGLQNVNDAGAYVVRSPVTGQFYCARDLGRGLLPFSDGRCGPEQACWSCKRLQDLFDTNPTACENLALRAALEREQVARRQSEVTHRGIISKLRSDLIQSSAEVAGLRARVENLNARAAGGTASPGHTPSPSALNGPSESFLCPIRREVFQDPVIVVETATTYDRAAIQEWFQRNSTDPMSNLVLTSTRTIPNIALRNSIEEWRARQ